MNIDDHVFLLNYFVKHYEAMDDVTYFLLWSDHTWDVYIHPSDMTEIDFRDIETALYKYRKIVYSKAKIIQEFDNLFVKGG